MSLCRHSIHSVRKVFGERYGSLAAALVPDSWASQPVPLLAQVVVIEDVSPGRSFVQEIVEKIGESVTSEPFVPLVDAFWHAFVLAVESFQFTLSNDAQTNQVVVDFQFYDHSLLGFDQR